MYRIRRTFDDLFLAAVLQFSHCLQCTYEYKVTLPGAVVYSIWPQSHWRRQLWGTGERDPSTPRLTTIYFLQCTLTSKKSDSDYMSTVSSCENPATFACAPPGTKSWQRHCPEKLGGPQLREFMGPKQYTL